MARGPFKHYCRECGDLHVYGPVGSKERTVTECSCSCHDSYPNTDLAKRIAQHIDDLICARVEERARIGEFNSELCEVSEDCVRRLGEALGEAITSSPEDD